MHTVKGLNVINFCEHSCGYYGHYANSLDIMARLTLMTYNAISMSIICYCNLVYSAVSS